MLAGKGKPAGKNEREYEPYFKSASCVADKYNGVSLIIRIIVGLIAGTALALVVPHMTWIGEFGTLFVSALKAVAPILVFVLVASALAQGNSKLDGRFGTVLFLYLFTTFLSAVVAVLTSRMFRRPYRWAMPLTPMWCRRA